MIINCTPHDVAVYNTTDCILQDGRLYLREDEDTEEYPVPEMLAQAYPERDDLLIPGSMVRDKDDDIVGCVDFSRV